MVLICRLHGNVGQNDGLKRECVRCFNVAWAQAQRTLSAEEATMETQRA